MAKPVSTFNEAARAQVSMLAPLEKKCLTWLAAHMPQWVNSDQLTALGLAALFVAGLAYWQSRYDRRALFIVIVCLAVNWFGDSLDGTLARFRNRQRPRYGFYVDHIVDCFGALFLLSGLALSGYMSPSIAIGLLIAFLMLSIEVYLATYTLGKFEISIAKFSPTELRILLAIGNLALFYKPVVKIMGEPYLMFDVGGAVGIAGMSAMLLFSVIRHTLALYRAEPLR